MKRLFCTVTFFVSVGLNAQTPAPPPATPTAPGLPASPAARGLPSSPQVPGLPGFTGQAPVVLPTNAFSNLNFTNQFGTNFTGGDLAAALAVLQNDLQQALPLLAAFNGGFQSTAVTTPTTGVNLSQNLSGNAGANLGANASANLATPAGGVAATTSPNIPAAGNVAVSAVPVPATAAGGSFGANTIASVGSPDATRLMLILQNDMERMLPLVAGVNGGGLTLFNGTNFVGVATNQLGTAVPNRPVERTSSQTPAARVVAPRPLAPTGR